MAESLPTWSGAAGPTAPATTSSQQWVDYTGIPEPEQLGYGWLEQVHPDDRERVRRGVDGPRSGPEAPLDVEFRIRAASGGYRWFKTARRPHPRRPGRRS